MGSERQKVVLAYSGGLDTSVILKWLIEEKGLEVIAFVADVGQEEDLEAIQKKAYATGASKVYVADVKEEFAQNFAFPILRANAVYEGGYFLGTSIARPLIAKEQLVVAHKEGATYVSHGATGKGNDQVRFELTYYALDPRIKVIAPWREWDLTSRTRLLEYAKTHNIPISLTAGNAYSIDKNLLHVSY
jgi:argininosuccinate synthase